MDSAHASGDIDVLPSTEIANDVMICEIYPLYTE